MKYIKAQSGEKITVDDKDHSFFKQWKWYVASGGYACRCQCYPKGKQKTIRMHHLILPMVPGFEVDHRNNNKLDNTRSNLQYATHKENGRKCLPQTRPMKSRFKGVTKAHASKNWEARIRVDGERIHLGSFKTQEDAACAYNLAAKEHFGKFALINEC